MVIVLVIALGVLVGTTSVGWPSGWVLEYRLGRSCLAAFVGIALATAGVGYQAVLRNPLAEPYLLGVSGGAALAVFAWSLPGVVLGGWLATVGREVAGFVGGMAAVAMVLTLAGARGRLDPSRLLLVGVVVGIFAGGLFALLVQLTREPSGGAMSFLFGRIGDPTTGELVRLTIVTAVLVATLALLSGPAAMLAAGEEEARASGVRVDASRWAIVIVASLLASTATAASGPIGFVGLMAPHLARLVVGVDVRRVLPTAAAIGAGLLVLSDALGRLSAMLLGSEIAAGVVTNLIGGPFFLLLLSRTTRRTGR